MDLGLWPHSAYIAEYIDDICQVIAVKQTDRDTNEVKLFNKVIKPKGKSKFIKLIQKVGPGYELRTPIADNILRDAEVCEHLMKYESEKQ